MSAFDYPPTEHHRRHGPQGYVQSRSFRPWLRDEFAFRCAYCLSREQWGRVTGAYALDHFQPQSTHPTRRLDYENHVYCCETCNALKGNAEIPDPCVVLTAKQIRVNPDGTIVGLTKQARRIIRILGLDSDSFNRWRRIWLRNIELAAKHDPQQFQSLMGFPDDLPDLAALRPPGGNCRPDGIAESHFAKRQRGLLPDVY